MPYERVCKTIQIRPPRKYSPNDVGRIAAYSLRTSDKALILAAVMRALGFSPCSLSSAMASLVSLVSIIRAAILSIATSVAIQQIIVSLSKPFVLRIPIINRIVLVVIVILSGLVAVVEYVENMGDLNELKDLLNALAKTC